MSIENSKDKFRPEGYPQSYLDGFKVDDSEIVKRYVEFLRNQQEEPAAIVVKETGRGIKVYRRFTRSDGQMEIGINWSEPEKYPCDYSEYASTFWGFEGPERTQVNRANLLAQDLGIGVVRKSEGTI